MKNNKFSRLSICATLFNFSFYFRLPMSSTAKQSNLINEIIFIETFFRFLRATHFSQLPIDRGKVCINEFRALNWKLKFLAICFDDAEKRSVCLIPHYFLCAFAFSYAAVFLASAPGRNKNFLYSITSQCSHEWAWIFHFNNGAISPHRSVFMPQNI